MFVMRKQKLCSLLCIKTMVLLLLTMLTMVKTTLTMVIVWTMKKVACMMCIKAQAIQVEASHSVNIILF